MSENRYKNAPVGNHENPACWDERFIFVQIVWVNLNLSITTLLSWLS